MADRTEVCEDRVDIDTRKIGNGGWNGECMPSMELSESKSDGVRVSNGDGDDGFGSGGDRHLFTERELDHSVVNNARIAVTHDFEMQPSCSGDEFSGITDRGLHRANTMPARKQLFWGERVHAKRVGPAPIPVDQFSLQNLIDAIEFMLLPEVKDNARELAKLLVTEDGATGVVKALHKQLPRRMPPTRPSPLPPNLVKSCFGTVQKYFGCS